MCTPIFIVFAYFLKASRQSICVNEDMDRLDVVCLLILKVMCNLICMFMKLSVYVVVF